MKVNIKKLDPAAVVPEYATDGAACFDICAIGAADAFYDTLMDNPRGAPVLDGTPVIFRTGLSFEIPPGCALVVYSRSGAGFGKSTRLENGTGIIDSDYRGELLVSLIRDDSEKPILTVRRGDRIAQAMIVQAPRVEFDLVDDLTETARGAGGFGSTGQ